MTTNYQNFAQPWQDQQRKQELLPVQSNNSWFFAHHPFNWEIAYIKKGKKTYPVLLPQLKTIQEMAGVNGVRDNGDNNMLISKLKRQGYTIIDPNVNDYMRIYPAHGGNYYTSKFEKLENLAGRLIKSFEQDEFTDFRMGLVASGAINIPHEHVLKLMKLDQNDKINQFSKDQLNPSTKSKMVAAIAKLEDIEKAIAELKEKGIDSYEK